MRTGIRGSKVLVLLTVLLLAPVGTRASEEAVMDIAMQADEVNREHCALSYSQRVEAAADALMVVAETWSRISRTYDETGAPVLLFWRGALAQCLGRIDAAGDDLNTFVEGEETGSPLAGLVRQANVRLRRLAANRSGPSSTRAIWARLPPFEMEISHRAAFGRSTFQCTDDLPQGPLATPELSTINDGCRGAPGPDGPIPAEDQHLTFVRPARLALVVRAYPSRNVGIRTDLVGVAHWGFSFGEGPPMYNDEHQERLGLWAIGMEFRFPIDGGQAPPGLMRLAIQAITTNETFRALAGNLAEGFFVAAPVYGGETAGAQLSVEGTLPFPRDARLVIDLQGNIRGRIPPSPSEAQHPTPACGDNIDCAYAGMLQATRAQVSMTASLQPSGDGGRTALGPTLGLMVDYSNLRLPNFLGSTDTIGHFGQLEGADSPIWTKAYSTRRLEMALTLGIRATIGLGPPRD